MIFPRGSIILAGLADLVVGVWALALNGSTGTAGLALMSILLSPCASSSAEPATPAAASPASSTHVAESLPDSKPGPESRDGVTPKPDWVDQPAGLQGTIYRTTVKSGLFVTPAECQKALAPKIRDAVMHYADEVLGPDAARQVGLDDELIQRLCKGNYLETVTSATVGPMQQAHALLEFDGEARGELNRRFQATVVADRLGRVAITTGIVLGLLAVACGYLKLDILTSGQMRGRLRFAAVVAILLVATGAAAARWVLLL